jgi:Fic family protein
MIFTPLFTITESILNNLTTIATSVAAIELAPLIPKWEVSLRRDALIHSAHSSTAIEGNPLSLEQVSDLAAGRDIMVQRKAKLEVLNYLSTLEKIPQLAEENFSEALILKMHRILTHKVLDNPQHSGAYRQISVVVGNRLTGEVSFRPPKAHEIPGLMKAFLAWLKEPTQNRNSILEAGIAHYEFVRIHPFVDGNGRTARTLASLILFKRGFDTKRFFALDDYYDHDRPAYYAALKTVDPKRQDLTKWLEYFIQGVMVQIEGVKKRVLELSLDVQRKKKHGQIALNERQMRIVEFVHKNNQVTNRDLQKLFSVSRKTAGEYLTQLVKMNVLASQGKGRSLFYTLN